MGVDHLSENMNVVWEKKKKIPFHRTINIKLLTGVFSSWVSLADSNFQVATAGFKSILWLEGK